MLNVKETVIDLISSSCSFPRVDEYLRDNDSLAEIGLDSISFIRIIVAIEQEFDIEFDEVALDFSKFTSLDSLCKYIKNEVDKRN